MSVALELATSVGAKLHGAELASRLLQDASKAGFADFYWPVVSRIVRTMISFRLTGS